MEKQTGMDLRELNCKRACPECERENPAVERESDDASTAQSFRGKNVQKGLITKALKPRARGLDYARVVVII